MFQLSNQYNELLSQYEIMAKEGYNRTDGSFVKNVYSDAEPLKFSDQLEKIIGYFNAKTALDYGSGGSDLNNTKLSNGEKFIDYIGLNKIHSFEPARSKRNKRKSDIVLCFDVLEHIFINDVPWVINDLFKYANKCVVINVACYNAAALLPNGENAHITVRPPSWWLGQIECISSLHPEIYWALFASESYNNSNFYGVHRMKDRLDSENFYQ
ncbi:MAG: hypothetical protein CMN37_07315 [SAR116 cluster bacterium]|nr:hypothetical protein [SAR116 cluster bacterium]